MIVHAHVLHLAHLDCRKRSRNESQDPSLVSLISYHRADFHIRMRLAASCSDFPITTTKVLSKRQYRERPCMQTLYQHPCSASKEGASIGPEPFRQVPCGTWRAAKSRSHRFSSSDHTHHGGTVAVVIRALTRNRTSETHSLEHRALVTC